jgi:hypothetical protein
MIRIVIEWDFISPTLQTVSGVAHLHYVPDPLKPSKELTRFRINSKPGSLGYSSLDKKGIPTVYLDAVKVQLDEMVRAFRQGVTMDKELVTWVIKDDLEKSLGELSKIPEKVSESDVCYAKQSSDYKS